MGPVTFELPWPPSVNHFLRHVELPLGDAKCPRCRKHLKSRVATLISSDGRAWLKSADRALHRLGFSLMHGPLAVEVILFPPDRRKIDVDNRLKAILDGLKRRKRETDQLAWLFADDDSQVEKLTVVKGSVVAGGKCLVTVSELPKSAGAQPELTFRADGDDDGQPPETWVRNPPGEVKGATMKLMLVMKNPDCVSDMLDEAAKESAGEATGLDAMEFQELAESRREKLARDLDKWIEYGEYVRIEFDTDAGTATVLPVR